MLIPDEPVFEKPLANGLTVRTVSTLDELDRVAALSAIVHEPAVGVMTRKIFSAHPNVTGRDLVYIEADQTHEVVATLCLIPWMLSLNGVDLPTAELGIVGTLESYRNQGLNRILMDYFWQRYRERGAALSIIQGIPYFYRQYGYEYAMLPLEGGWRLQPDQIPTSFDQGYTVRPASPADIPDLARLYNTQAARQNISARRSLAIWEYLLARTPQPEAMQHDTWMVLHPSGDPVAYFRIPDFHFEPNLLTIDEVSDVSFGASLAILNHLKSLTAARGKDGIRLHLPQNSQFLALARSLGAHDMDVYSWQVRIPDPAAFMGCLAPLFEERLENSMFLGLTGTFGLNIFKSVIGLTFENGRLMSVGSVREDERTILNIPPTQLVPLILGGSTLDEIHARFPDAYARGPWGLLVDTLFPKNSAFIATQY